MPAKKKIKEQSVSVPSAGTLKMEPLPPLDQIPLDSHIFIEASAGTGKTYTLENLILLALKKKNSQGQCYINLPEILTVTFTEKAAGELRERIRSKLTKEISELSINPKSDHGILEHLKKQLSEFDSASVSTIHGFCYRIIREYSDLLGEQSSLEVIDKDPYARRFYRDFLRRVFYSTESDSEPAEENTWFLLFINFNVKEYKGDSIYEEDSVRLAELLTPHEELRPSPEKEFTDSQEIPRYIKNIIYNTGKSLDDLAHQFLNLTDSFRNDPEGFRSSWEAGIASSGLHGNTKKPLLGLAEPVAEILYRYDDLGSQAFCYELYEILINRDTVKNLLNDSEKFSKIENSLPGKIFSIVAKIRGLTRALPGIFKSAAIKYVSSELIRLRSEEGLISFSDMLQMVHRSLCQSDHSEVLINELRNRFRIGIVDEFQDTDHLQWEIFHKIFIESHENPLILVGDPKQAIYSFRGADVFAYLGARNAMAETGKARFYQLPVNYRSQPELIRQLNVIFNKWFGDKTASGGIDYYEVTAPEPDKIRYRLFSPENTLQPVQIIPLEESNSAKSKIVFFNYIADEIIRITSGKDGIMIGKDQPSSPCFSDITVLFHTKNDVKKMENIFRKKGIPCSFYKKPGLYQSDEAFETEVLLTALLNPRSRSDWNRALVTSFFRDAGITEEDIFTPESPVRLLIDHWLKLAENRNWPQFFYSLRTKTAAAGISDERRITDLNHIMEDLEYELMSENLSLEHAVRLLRTRRLEENEVRDESSLHRKETEEPRVSLMTIHASKGLEFPIVFLASGFSLKDKGRESCYIFHESGKKIIDLSKDNPESKEKHVQEADAEALRLLYVALTRAIYRIYFPIYKGEGKLVKGPLSASEVKTPGFKLVNDSSEISSLFTGIPKTDSSLSAIIGKEETPDEDKIQNNKQNAHLKDDNASDYLNYESDFRGSDYRGRITLLDSYSSLKKRLNPEESVSWNQEEEKLLRIEKNSFPEEISADPSAAAEIQEENRILGYGKETGNLIHEILEVLPFRMFRHSEKGIPGLLENPASAFLIRNYCTRFKLETEKADQTISRLISRTLNTPLSVADGIRLSDLEEADYLRETEFYLKSAEFSHIFGFMDLVFRTGDRYWIADWKTDNLHGAYDPASLKTAMKERGYDHQYIIYTMALDRWLAGVLPGYSFEKNFGGVYYFFMRGINPENPDHGVFTDRPDYSIILNEKKAILKNQRERYA